MYFRHIYIYMNFFLFFLCKKSGIRRVTLKQMTDYLRLNNLITPDPPQRRVTLGRRPVNPAHVAATAAVHHLYPATAATVLAVATDTATAAAAAGGARASTSGGGGGGGGGDGDTDGDSDETDPDRPFRLGGHPRRYSKARLEETAASTVTGAVVENGRVRDCLNDPRYFSGVIRCQAVGRPLEGSGPGRFWIPDTEDEDEAEQVERENREERRRQEEIEDHYADSVAVAMASLDRIERNVAAAAVAGAAHHQTGNFCRSPLSSSYYYFFKLTFYFYFYFLFLLWFFLSILTYRRRGG